MKTKITILFTGSLLFNLCVYSQINLQNTGILFISSTTDTVYINGDLTNTSAAALSNSGKLYLKQNLINDQASMATGTGTLFLNGSIAQTVSGTNVFKTFNLVTNNAAGITLNNNLSIGGTHTYSAGMLTTSATPNYLIYEAGSSYSGSNDARHVNGWIKKTGNTNFTFPVGNATYERPIALMNLTASGEFNVKHNRLLTPNRISVYNPLVYVDTSEYWTIDKISGASAQVAMNWDNNKIDFPNFMLSDVRATSYDGTFWRSIGGTPTGDPSTTGDVASSSISAFNRNFTFGSISFVLPVKIINFTAEPVNDYIKINWTIGNELNVSSYELQRSDDGINFYSIYSHMPYNLNNTALYKYNDRKPLTGTAFYRLKIYNQGMQFNYSHIISVLVNNTEKSFYVITNPVNANINLYAGSTVKGQYKYSITNTSGQLVQSGSININSAGNYSIHLKPALASGEYILVVQNETTRFQKMIIKN
jgi:hypothetical protein